MKEFFENLVTDILNGLLDEEGYTEPFWKKVLLFIPRMLIGVMLLPVMAFILFLEALTRL